jgi:hypothetical protein
MLSELLSVLTTAVAVLGLIVVTVFGVGAIIGTIVDRREDDE